MSAYLITWKPAAENRDKGWPEEKFEALSKAVGKRPTNEPWRFSRKRGVKLGERVFLIRQGKRGHAILGYGTVAKLPTALSDSTTIRFEALVGPKSGTVLATQSELRAITQSFGVWNTNSSGIILAETVASSLEELVVGRSPVADGSSQGPSVNPDWRRDELILALDFYLRHRHKIPDKGSAPIRSLSATLQRLASALGAGAGGNTSFRNESGVYMKLMNFRRLDPEFTQHGKKGLQRGAKGDEQVWDEFASDPDECERVCAAIVASIDDPETVAVDLDEWIEEASEGRLLTRRHVSRERNKKLVASKLGKVLKSVGKLECEVCGFDFFVKYGVRGRDFLECHHTKPVTLLAEGQKTHINDLALVCANCHRMIHRRKPWLSLEDLRLMLGSESH